MNESDLRERLSDLVADQPTMRQGSADDVRLGRRRVRLQRAGAAIGTGALVVAAAAGAVAWWPVGSEQADAPVAASSKGQLMQRCTAVDNGALDPEVFGSGSRIIASETAGTITQLVIVSGDGRWWAGCRLQDDPTAEFNGNAETFPMDPPSDGDLETAPYGWGHGVFWYYDRFPSEVAEVEIRFRGGPALTRPTVDGFVVAVAEDPAFTLNWDGWVLFTLRDADGDVLGRTGGWPGLGPELTLPRRYWSLVPSE